MANLDYDDWDVIDDLRIVTYFVRTGASAFATGATVPNVLRRATQRAEILPGTSTVIFKSAVAFHLWQNQLGVITPKAGDVIQETTGRRWVVNDYDMMDEGERFRCVCVKEQ